MSKFKSADFQIKKELDKTNEVRVVKLNAPAEPRIQNFQLPQFKKGNGSYSEVKAKYGALAVTDPERAARSKQDGRFSLNPLLRDPLSVEEEERRVIEERVRDRVDALADEAKNKAAAFGYEDGLKKGYQEAYAKFQKEGAERLERFTALLQEAEGAKELIFRANERFLTEMIYRIARMVLLKELAADKDYVLRLARELIERVGVRENVTLRISEADAETMGMLKEGLEKTLGNLKNLNIQISNQVQHGGCIVETEWNAIDASVETQLQGLYQALNGRDGGVQT